MSKNSEFNLCQYLFPIKVLGCFSGLLLGFFVFVPTASMQEDKEVRVISGNANRMIENGNYRPTPEPPKSTVRGRVIYADTGRPARRVSLMMLSAKTFAGGGGRENTGVTNERGEFEIKNVSEGRYFVSINAPGVLSPFSSITNFEGMRTGRESSEIADIARNFQEIVVNGINDIDITVPVQRGAAIMGRIMYADGEAAIGVRVEVLRKKENRYNAVISNLTDIFGAMLGGGAGSLKTDDRGVFRVAGLPAGEYVVRVVENVTHSDKGNRPGDDEMMILMGFNPNSMVATYYPNTDDVKKAEIIKLEIGQEHSEVNITIPERTFLNLSGTIVNKATRQPVKDARISIKSKDDVNSLFNSLGEIGTKNQSDEQGRWNYKQLPAGKYTITVQPPYVYESPDETNPQKPKQPKLAQLEREIVIEEKDLTDLVLELGYGGSISGTISYENGQMLPQTVTVTATDENGKFSESGFASGKYTEDGKPIPRKTDDFKIEGIPNGKVFLNIGGRAYGEGTEEDSYVKSILFNGKDINHTPLAAKEGVELKGVQIVLSKDVGKIKGKVLKADKTPVTGAKISFVLTDKQKWGNFTASLYASTNSDGEFEISGAPGEYFVVFIKDSDALTDDDKEKSLAEKRREWLEKETVNAQKVTVKAKETETISLTLPEK